MRFMIDQADELTVGRELTPAGKLVRYGFFRTKG
jgi:hypothetical protein